MYSGAVFSFDPCWQEPIIERLTWLTNVLPHRDASEQRRQVRLYPRRQLEYLCFGLTSLERSRMDNFIRAYQHTGFLLPIWTDVQTLTVQANSGQNVVNIATETYDYDADQYVILWANHNNYEAVQIDSLSANSLTLIENLANTWPVGTQVLPARLARMAQSLKGVRHSNDVRFYRFQFDLDESSPSFNRITAISPSLYNLSVDIFGDFADSNELLDWEYQHPLQVIDGQTGVVRLDAGAASVPALLLPYQKLFTDRSQVSQWWGFLERRQGQRLPLILTTYEEDFGGSYTVTTNASFKAEITYPRTGYAAAFANNQAGDLVWVTPRENFSIFTAWTDPIIVQRVESVVDLGNDNERATLIDFLPASVSVDPQRWYIGLARYCRLAGDVVETNWLSPCVAETKISFREMYDLF